ncbi:MAG: hypothetical protein ACK5KM_08450 [Hyphomicrobiaceae bacterium]
MQLSDLAGDCRLEVTCRRCGHTRYEAAADLAARDDVHARIYLDEVEALLRCRQRQCGGAVRISIIADHDTEGFMGGLA